MRRGAAPRSGLATDLFVAEGDHGIGLRGAEGIAGEKYADDQTCGGGQGLMHDTAQVLAGPKDRPGAPLKVHPIAAVKLW
jgi:hypothetical protein